MSVTKPRVAAYPTDPPAVTSAATSRGVNAANHGTDACCGHCDHSAGTGTSRASPAFTTKYSYYGVSGRSKTGIFASMLKHLQRTNGRRDHAFTSIDISRPRTVRSAKGCSIDRLSVRFLIRLPRLDNAASLSANDRRLWQQFSTAVRKHEEAHWAIWMGCARRIEARIAGLRRPSCREVERKARRVIEQARIACRKKNVALDAAERNRLEYHPFMKGALAPIFAPPQTAKKRKN